MNTHTRRGAQAFARCVVEGPDTLQHVTATLNGRQPLGQERGDGGSFRDLDRSTSRGKILVFRIDPDGVTKGREHILHAYLTLHHFRTILRCPTVSLPTGDAATR